MVGPERLNGPPSRLRPADYEELGEGRTGEVSGRKVTHFSDGVGQVYQNRAYAESGWGRFAGWRSALRGRLVVVSIFYQYLGGAQE